MSFVTAKMLLLLSLACLYTNKTIVMAQTTIQPQLPLLRRALSDATIHNAVKLWINGGPTEKKEIEKLYGNNFGEWNTSLVTDMSALFQNQERFNEDISGWDVSRVTNFQDAFQGASSFTHDLSSWNVVRATNFRSMFEGASSLRVQLCWSSLGWTAFVDDIFCGTAGASFDPCCVDESMVMVSCCGNQACRAFCTVPGENNNNKNSTNNNSAIAAAVGTIAGSTPDEGAQTEMIVAQTDEKEGDDDDEDNTNENPIINASISVAPSIDSTVDFGDLLEPSFETEEFNPKPPSESLDVPQRSRQNDSSNVTIDSSERNPSVVVAGIVVGIVGLLALLGSVVLLAYHKNRRSSNSMILDPDNTKQTPTLDQDDEDTDNGAPQPAPPTNLNNVTFEDTESPSILTRIEDTEGDLMMDTGSIQDQHRHQTAIF